ncbi:MAG: hypothetical protein AB7N76_05375 [Planctomycetota bacterium]
MAPYAADRCAACAADHHPECWERATECQACGAPKAEQPFLPLLERARETPFSSRLGAFSFLLALAVACFVRLYALDAKPLHHDEGVNAFFLTRLLEEGVYHYDPTNYHGPFLYYAGYLPLWAAKSPGPWSLRLVPALASALTLLLLLPLRHYLGWLGVATAAWLLALSPSAVYVGRTAIHESYFLAAVLGALVAIAAYVRRPRPWIPALLGLALALAYANKETGVISYAAIGCGGVLALLFARGQQPAGARTRLRTAWGWARGTWGAVPAWRPVSFAVPFTVFLLGTATLFVASCGLRALIWGAKSGNAWDVTRAFALDRLPAPARAIAWVVSLALLGGLLWGLRPALREWWEAQPRGRRPWLAALGVFAAALVVLFSSLFTSPPGLFGLSRSLIDWVARGIAREKTGHEHELPYYLEILLRLETPLLYLGCLGSAAALLRRQALGLLLLGWGWSTIAVYSVLAYKTPWLIVNLSLPLCLLAGYGLATILELLHALAARRAAGQESSPWVPRLAGALALLLPLLAVAPNPAPFGPDFDVPKVELPAEQAGLDPAAKRKRLAWLEAWRWLRAPHRPWCEVLWDLNLVNPDDPRYPSVYGQTDREALLLFARLREELAKGKKLTVTAKEYWPLPAYIHPYRAGYLNSVGSTPPSDLLVVSTEQEWKLKDATEGWASERYELRQGVWLVLLAAPDSERAPRER